MPDPTPRVFISYAWTSDAHVDWVVGLGKRLMSDGVDVILDKWSLKKGHDIHAFMEQMVTDPSVTKVLAVCDSKYAAKADGREGGVGKETQIISPEVYAQTTQEKFIPLIRELDGNGQPFRPTYFKNTFYIDFTDDTRFEEKYDELLRDILDAPLLSKPPLGKVPTHILKPVEAHLKTSGAFTRLKNAVENERSYIHAVFDEYFDVFIGAMEDFRIAVTQANRTAFDEVVVGSIDQMLPYRDNFIECVLFMLKYCPGDATTTSIHSFIERLIPFQDQPRGASSWNECDFDNYRFFVYESFVYLVAACIRSRQYSTAATLIESEYHIPDRLRGDELRRRSADACNEFVRSLDDIRNSRLKLGRLSVTADMVKDRAPCGPITFREVLQADFLLYIRPHFPSQGAIGRWYPRCIPFAGRGGAFDLFAKASSDSGLDPLKVLLRIPDRNGLMDGLQRLMSANPLDIEWRADVDIESLLNLEELNRVSGRNVARQ